MARSLFQKPRGTGFAGRYYPEFEEDEWPRREPMRQKRWKAPLFIRIGLRLGGFILWAVAGFILTFCFYLLCVGLYGAITAP